MSVTPPKTDFSCFVPLTKQPHFNFQLLQVRVIFTASAGRFFQLDAIKELCQVFTDEDEWEWKQKGESLHIELRDWADAFLISPLSANTLSKIAHGLADNLVTCVARAWDFERPIIVSPAMNTQMWNHPLTSPQLELIQSWGVAVIAPQEKTLACGEVGIGAMADVKEISEQTQKAIRSFA
eukprot:c14516_g1_i2.p1 GENE.c14516_g1_i2~~c14516_g1_i2.p1  ORF type:complete len:181 (+),score=45.88 c14516_g1_i2:115-657(+)